ncbi:unnamed protein product [Closterium sp. NIES-54]
MEIARISLTHARAPYFLWPYAVQYAAHPLNLWPRVSRPEVSPTSLWTGSPGDASRFRDSSDFTFYHPHLHWFLDSRNVNFDESVPYYTRYLRRGLPVPPPPLFLTPTPPLALPVQPPPPWSSPVRCVTRYPQPPSVAPQVTSPSPQSSSQPTADPAGAGVCVEDPGGASSIGVGVGAKDIPVRGPGSGGAGVGAEPMTTGDSSLQGAGVSPAFPGGATTGGAGAPSTGSVEPGASRVASGGAGSEDRLRRACEEQLELERERLELERQQQELRQLEEEQQQQQQPLQQEQQQPPPPPPFSGLRTLGLPSPSPPSSPSPPIYGPMFPPPDYSPAIFPRSQPPLSPPLSHTRASCSPRARPSSPVPVNDLRTVLYHSSPPRPSPSVLPSPLDSALTASCSTLVIDYYCTYRPVLSRVHASLVTLPRASLSSVSALTAIVTEFATTHRLDYATRVVAAPPTSPLAIGGESALGCDALEDRKFGLEFLAAASPHLCAMLLAPEGDPDALDIPTPRTYAEAVSGPWASRWRAAMDAEMASYRSTGTYIDEVPPLGANVVDGMWIFRVKRPPGSPLVFKQVLQRFELQHSTVQRTPLAVDHKLTGPFPDEPFEPSGPYAELVGCLMYLMTCTHLDLAFPLNILACFVAPWRHPPVHWTVVVRVAKYLATTSGMGLVLGGRQSVVLTGHCDSSYADDVETHRSTQGYNFSLGSRAVSWRSTRSSSVSTSTAEVEIYIGAMAAHELRWLTFLLTDLGERPSSAPTLFTNNKATILLC